MLLKEYCAAKGVGKKSELTKHLPPIPSVLLKILKQVIEERRFAYEMGWKPIGDGKFAGRLENGATWEIGVNADPVFGKYLRWSGSPLACRTENRLMLISCSENAESRRLKIRENSLELIGTATGKIVSIEPCSEVETVSRALTEVLLRQASTRNFGASILDLKAVKVGNQTFTERFILLSNNEVFARQVVTDTVVRELLNWDDLVQRKISIHLALNQLVVELRPGSADWQSLAQLGRIAQHLAENANHSNAAPYWARLRQNKC